MQGINYKPQGINKRPLIITLLGISILAVLVYFFYTKNIMCLVTMLIPSIMAIVYMAQNHKASYSRIFLGVAFALMALMPCRILLNFSKALSDSYFFEYYPIFLAIVEIISNIVLLAALVALAVFVFIGKPQRKIKMICLLGLVIASAVEGIAVIVYNMSNYFDVFYAVISPLFYLHGVLFGVAMLIYYTKTPEYIPNVNNGYNFTPNVQTMSASQISADELIALKASFERGEIPEAEYQIRRQELLRKL